MSSPSVWRRLQSTITLRHDYSVEPLGFKWRQNTFFIVATVGVGLFTDLFLYGLVVPILPFILQDRIGIPQEQVQSYTSALLATYAGASVVLSPVAGYIADKTSSRQLPFLCGLAALFLATALLFSGKSIAVLIVARIAQGASSAFVWTIGLALCLDTVGPDNLGKTIGSIFSFTSVGELFAPVLGGVVYKKAGLGAVSALALAILGVDFLMRLLVIEKKVAARYDKELAGPDADGNDDDQEDSGDGEADEDTPLLGSKAEDDSFRIPPNQASIVQRIPILYCLSSPSLLAAQLVALIQAVLLAAFDATIPTHAEELYGFDSLKAGLLFVPLGVLNLIGGPIAGWAVDRYGTKWVAALGYAYLVIPLTLLRLPGAEPLETQVALYASLLGLTGVGLAAIGSPSIVEAGLVVDKYYKRNPEFFGENGPYAQLYGMNSAIFSLGLSVGPLLAGGLKDAIGYGNANAVLAGVAGVTAVICTIWLGGRPSFLKREKN